MSPDLLLLERFVVAVEAAANALERLAQAAPEPERCPKCQSYSLDEIDDAGLIMVHCSVCEYAWFPEEEEIVSAAKEGSNGTKH